MKITTGTTVTVPAAVSRPHMPPLSVSTAMPWIATGIVEAFRLVSTRANSSSSYAIITLKMSDDTSAGVRIGRMMRKYAPSREVPSIIADSSSSFGMARKNERMSHMTYGMRNVE